MRIVALSNTVDGLGFSVSQGKIGLVEFDDRLIELYPFHLIDFNLFDILSFDEFAEWYISGEIRLLASLRYIESIYKGEDM